MKDRLQNIAIILLLISSIFLSLLNLGVQFEDIFESKSKVTSNIIFNSKAIIADAVMPVAIAVNFGEEDHTLLNNSKEGTLWPDSIEMFRQIFEDKKRLIESVDIIDDSIYNQFLKQKSIVLIFNKEISTLTLLNALEIEDPKEIVSQYQDMDSVYISLEKNFIIIREKEKNSLITFSDLNRDKLNNTVDNIYEAGFNPYSTYNEALDNGRIGYLPQVSRCDIEVVTFNNLLKTLNNGNIENIVFSFLGKEVNYLREIKEEGIQTIYVDRENILKIRENGLISYFNPDPPASSERNLYISLETALAFISNNLGFDSSLYLKEIKTIEYQDYTGYKFIFGKNSKGFKVELSTEEIVDYIEIDVFNDHVRRFSQLFRGEVSDGVVYHNIDSSQEIRQILKANIELINRRIYPDGNYIMTLEEILKKVEYADILYIDRGNNEKLSLIWKVIIGDEEFEFEIKDKDQI